MKAALRLSWVPVALALIGCGGHGSTSPVSQGKLDGDVFIVTEGAQNVKLGLRRAGIVILAAVQSTLDALKSQKSGTWGCFVPTLTEVFELCYETPQACVRFPSNSCNQSTDCSRTSNPDKRIILRGPEPERSKKPHSDNAPFIRHDHTVTSSSP
jgi:hypothetical protein